MNSKVSKPFRLRVDGGNGTISGQVSSGRLSVGDPVKILPQAATTIVASLKSFGNQTDSVTAGDIAELTFIDDVEISPGDIVCTRDKPVEAADQFEVQIIWQGNDAMLAGRPYEFLFGSFACPGSVTNIKYKLRENRQTHLAATTLEKGEQCIATISIRQPVAFTTYEQDSTLGTFTIIDPESKVELGSGRINFALRRASNIHRQALDLDRHAHAALKNQKPCVLWLTGLSGSGKSTIANALETRLHELGRHTFLLDGDNVRHGLNRDLGFTDADRVENIRRISEVARLMTDAGLIVITSFISPFNSERQMARDLMQDGEFFEIFVDAPLEVCEKRDEKGLYAKARAGEIKNFTGIDSAYEPPEDPEISLDSTALSPDQAADVIISFLREKNRLP